MAALPETSNFDASVTQIETTEPVVGGPTGVANRALIQLANRTRWLKDQISSILTDLGANYALRNGDYSGLRARSTTKADVGLDLVSNFDKTNLATGGETDRYATGAAAKQAWDKALEALTAAQAVDTGVGRVRAWVNFTGAGVVAVNAGANVAAVSDDGTGLYTITFSNPLSTASYVVMGAGYAFQSAYTFHVTATAKSTTSLSVMVTANAGSAWDAEEVMVAVLEV